MLSARAERLDAHVLGGVEQVARLGAVRAGAGMGGVVMVREPQGKPIGLAAQALGVGRVQRPRRMRQNEPARRIAWAFGAEDHLKVIGAGECARRLRERTFENFGGRVLGGHVGRCSAPAMAGGRPALQVGEFGRADSRTTRSACGFR